MTVCHITGERPPFLIHPKAPVTALGLLPCQTAHHVKNEMEELLKDRRVSDEPGPCPLATRGYQSKEYQTPRKTFPMRAKRAPCFPPNPEREAALRNLPL